MTSQKAKASGKSESELEETFMFQLRAVGIKGWQREVKFHPQRKWKADFCWLSEKLIIEIQGGLWHKGRRAHGSPEQYARDARKAAEAQFLGFRVIHLTPAMVRSGEGLSLVERALGKEK